MTSADIEPRLHYSNEWTQPSFFQDLILDPTQYQNVVQDWDTILQSTTSPPSVHGSILPLPLHSDGSVDYSLNEQGSTLGSEGVHDNPQAYEQSLSDSQSESTSHVPQQSVGQMFDSRRSISPMRQTRSVTNMPSVLCSYFFQEIIPLYCVWDSRSNWMRSVAETHWQNSAPLYHTMQSMAAACLAASFPQLGVVARGEHREAVCSLRRGEDQAAVEDSTALSGFLLGHTASWHSPRDLAVERFQSLRSTLQRWTYSGQQQQLVEFIDEAMGYWRMLLSFLTEDASLRSGRSVSIIGPTYNSDKILPHPFSGISGRIVDLVAETGVLVFQHRRFTSNLRYMRESDVNYFQKTLSKARWLEKELLSYTRGPPESILDPGDPRTKVLDFENIDEAYRCTALLQLYRVFPDLLADRYEPFNSEIFLLRSHATGSPTEQERETWLTKLSMYILSLLRQIAFESGTRCMQPFIFVAVSSELRLNHATSLSTPAYATLNEFDERPDAGQIEISRARQFILSRLAAYEHVFPLPKVREIVKLVNHIWSELDIGRSDVYWVDVAYNRNLGTMMG